MSEKKCLMLSNPCYWGQILACNPGCIIKTVIIKLLTDYAVCTMHWSQVSTNKRVFFSFAKHLVRLFFLERWYPIPACPQNSTQDTNGVIRDSNLIYIIYNLTKVLCIFSNNSYYLFQDSSICLRFVHGFWNS